MNRSLMNISITGSGPVAMALTLFLRRQGIAPERLFVAPLAAQVPPAAAARAIALSQGSVQLLNRIIDVPAGAPIEKVDIGVLGHGLHSQLHPGDLGLTALGRVVRYQNLWTALQTAFEREQQRCGHRFEAPAQAGDALHIIADGRPDDDATRRQFEQVALTTELQTAMDSHALPLPGVAYERFKQNGPLALLPLPEPGRLSLVWCTTPDHGEQLQQMDADAFEQALATALGARFAPITLADERFVTPLQRAISGPPRQAGCLRLGNAAQTLHPVAGQGLNLGLRDAFETSAAMASAQEQITAPAAMATKIFSLRKTDRTNTVRLTDILAQLDKQLSWAGVNNGATQSIVIALLDTLGPLRRLAARRLIFGHRQAN